MPGEYSYLNRTEGTFELLQQLSVLMTSRIPLPWRSSLGFVYFKHPMKLKCTFYLLKGIVHHQFLTPLTCIVVFIFLHNMGTRY